eukprot:2997674-Lingulodinium_polyedra.AAC.1
MGFFCAEMCTTTDPRYLFVRRGRVNFCGFRAVLAYLDLVLADCTQRFLAAKSDGCVEYMLE